MNNTDPVIIFLLPLLFLMIPNTLCVNAKDINEENPKLSNTTTVIIPHATRGNDLFKSVAAKARTALNNIWTWFQKQEHSNEFIGRCFGAARKLKFVIPMIVFKLGVITTILVFLTIFSLKTIALLVLLFLMNSTGWATKLALSKIHKPEVPYTPQNVHLHVHPGKYGAYGGYSTIGQDHTHEWIDRNLYNSDDNSMGNRNLFYSANDR